MFRHKRKTIEINKIVNKERIEAYKLIKKETMHNLQRPLVLIDTVLFWDEEKSVWCIQDFEQEPILETRDLDHAINYLIEIEGAETVMDCLNDPEDDDIPLVVDEDAFRDLLA